MVVEKFVEDASPRGIKSRMSWQVLLTRHAEKQLRHLPPKEVRRVSVVIDAIQVGPFSGDMKKLGGFENSWRLRVGAYRVLFEVFPEKKSVFIYEIKRRTSKTY